MARKSNKTAHVLNLLAGHDQKKEPETEALETEAKASETEAKASESEPAAQPAPPREPEGSSAPQNVAVIDHTEADPVADLIQNRLLEAFGEEPPAQEELSVQEEPPAQEGLSTQEEPPAQEGLSVQEEPPAQEELSIQGESPAQEEALPSASAALEAAAEPAETTEIPPETAAPAQALEEETAPKDPFVSQTEPEQKAPAPAADIAGEPPRAEEAPEDVPPLEPDFQFVNVMETIVRDKIIYFMRQFDVCTCPRCVEDTIALTLNGLTPRYQVLSPGAVAPLLSFYTNRYISDVTVEATKACMEVKEHPRHNGED